MSTPVTDRTGMSRRTWRIVAMSLFLACPPGLTPHLANAGGALQAGIPASIGTPPPYSVPVGVSSAARASVVPLPSASLPVVSLPVVSVPSSLDSAVPETFIDLTADTPSADVSPLYARESIQRRNSTPNRAVPVLEPKTPAPAPQVELIDLTESSVESNVSGATELIDLTGGTTTASLPPTVSVQQRSGTLLGQNPVIELIDLTEGSAGPSVLGSDAMGAGTAETAYFIDLTDASSPLPAPVSGSVTVSSGNQTALVSPLSAQAALPTKGVVVRVVDGDTYVLQDGNRVRLSCVNTPEKSERIGPMVKEAAIRLLLNKEITLTYGPTAKDHYGRLVADVWINNQSMAEILLREGLAHLFIIPPTRPERYEAMLQAQRDARAANRGIWSEDRYRGVLHITSFHANSRGDDRENLEGEYVRIANTSGADLNLQGFALTNLGGRTLQLPAITIPEGYTFQVVSGVGDNGGSLTRPYKIFWNARGPVWNNDEDKATLLDPQGRWIDEAVHSPKRTHPTASMR